MIRISPSLLASDFSRLGEQARYAAACGADMLHIDVMDGHFVPNITIGSVVVSALRRVTGLCFDVHLMISRPLQYIGAFAEAGSDIITFHIEAEDDPAAVVEKIREVGCKVGIAVRPGTGLDRVLPLVERLDMVLVMTVEPGFGGQSFMPETMDKLRRLRAYADQYHEKLDLQVDGGIDARTASVAAANGANVFVAGTALFGRPDMKAAIQELRTASELSYRKEADRYLPPK